MSPREWLLTLACVFGIGFGQLLFKRAAAELHSATSLSQWIFNGWLILALIIYAIATVGWIWVLRTAPLNRAYPLFALAFIFVPVLAHFAFGESLRWNTFVGGALIVAGVVVATRL